MPIPMMPKEESHLRNDHLELKAKAVEREFVSMEAPQMAPYLKVAPPQMALSQVVAKMEALAQAVEVKQVAVPSLQVATALCVEVKQAAVPEPSPELLVELSRDPDPQLRAFFGVVSMEGPSAAELWVRQASNRRRTR